MKISPSSWQTGSSEPTRSCSGGGPYELFAGHWPRVTAPNDPIATRLNDVPKYLVSISLDRLEWNNSMLLQGDVLEEVAKLKDQPVMRE